MFLEMFKYIRRSRVNLECTQYKPQNIFILAFYYQLLISKIFTDSRWFWIVISLTLYR